MTILALHGLLDSPAGFRDLERELDSEIIAPRIPQNRTSLHSRSRWLEEWVQKEDLRDFHLLGHSLGGALAGLSAEKLRPQSLLLLAPVGFGQVRLAEALRSPFLSTPLRWSAPGFLGISPLVRGTYRHLFSYGGEMPDALQKEIQKNPKAILRRAEKEIEIVAQGSRDPIKESLYEGPVSALWGEYDRLVPWREGEDVLRVFPQAQVSLLPKVGHDLLREDPALLAGWVSKSLP